MAVGVEHKGSAYIVAMASALTLLVAVSGAGAQDAAPAITGRILYYANQAAVPDVMVQLVGTGGPAGAMTDATGAYALSDPGAGDWQVEPIKNGDTHGAISALDASQVLQEVVGLREFTPLQRLACDVTGDGSVSSLDAARILQYVAGLRTRFPVAENCGADWAFMPNAAAALNQQLIDPQMAPLCTAGSIIFSPLAPPVDGQSFLAVLFGDCTGNWQPAAPPPTDTPTPGDGTPSAVATDTPIPPTDTATPPASPTATASGTSTRTGTITATATRTGTNTATPTSTATPKPTYTSSPTPTQTCANGLAWDVSPPTLVSAQSGGNLWLAKTVPTDTGWGIFWLRQDPAAPQLARLYYAHRDFGGQFTAGPLLVTAVTKMTFRDHYYMAAWNAGHFGLLIANGATLYYYNMALDGTLSGQKAVGPPLFVDPTYDDEAEGDVDAFPGGFLGVVDGECDGHSCSYAFKLDTNGNPLTSPINLVDFDFTHQFYPVSAFDGAGFAILTVKDILITGGGVMTKYLPLSGAISSNAKVVPAKPYLWDEFPDIAWNGDHFGAVWTENSGRSWDLPWQIHFATFRRTKSASTLIAERVIDMEMPKTGHRWTTQMHAIGPDWVAQYTSRAADNSLVAVYELLGDDAQTLASIQPFPLSADALGSSPHFAAGHVGELGIARGSNLSGGGTEVSFYTLAPPACR